MLTSGKTHVPDPRPFQNRLDGSRWPDQGVPGCEDPDLLPYRPRAEYEPAENVNPLLLAYRDEIRYRFETAQDWESYEFGGTPAEVTDRWLWYITTGNQEVSWVPEHLLHAEAVLRRLYELHYFQPYGMV